MIVRLVYGTLCVLVTQRMTKVRRIKMYKKEIVLKGILNYIKKIPVLLTKDHFNKKCLELLKTSPFIKKYLNKRTERLTKRFPAHLFPYPKLHRLCPLLRILHPPFWYLYQWTYPICHSGSPIEQVILGCC
jgi:hypothetical protein